MLKLIQNRRSCRNFSEEAIDQETVKQIMKAALWAPTSKNNRPWEFVIVQDKEMLKKLATCKPHGAKFLEKAPLAIIILADSEKSDVWIEDTAITASFIQLFAESVELGSCWIQIRKRDFDDTKSAGNIIKDLLQIPANLEVASIIAIGKKARERRPYSEEDLLWEKVHNEFY